MVNSLLRVLSPEGLNRISGSRTTARYRSTLDSWQTRLRHLCDRRTAFALR